jgi:hypothetical protein
MRAVGIIVLFFALLLNQQAAAQEESGDQSCDENLPPYLYNVFSSLKPSIIITCRM